MFLKELQPQTETNAATKVKMFIRNSLEEIEAEVNEWMEKGSVRISQVAQSQCEKQGKFVFVLSVFYEPSVVG